MTDRVGQKLGSYQITGFLGKGGFAEVYRGEHVYLKTSVAVKVLQTRLTNQEDLDSFLKEAQTVAHLRHPGIVRVLDFGVADDQETPFLVMDYAAGGSLRHRHPRESRLPLPTIVSYVQQLAEALHYAHTEKLIHRDVKPENMLLDHHHKVLLSDFGIALIAQSSRYQSTQDVVGTVAYMSPEQIQGKPRPASDQYSLAIAVYEWLSGTRPFQGSFTELCTQHMFAPVPRLREKIPDASAQIEQVVTIALAKEPKERFSTIRAFATALEQASRSVSTSAETIIPSPSHPQLPVVQLAQQGETPPSPPRMQEAVTPVQLPLSVSTPLSIPPMAPAREGTFQLGQIIKLPITAATPGRRNFWRIGKEQLIAMGAGAIIEVTTAFTLDSISILISTKTPPLPLPSSPFFFALIYIIFVPSLHSHFFFSATSGPWVYLFISIVNLLAKLLINPSFSATVDFWIVVDFVIYLLPCIAYLKRGDSVSIRLAVGWSAASIILSQAVYLLYYLITSIPSYLSPSILFDIYAIPVVIYTITVLPLLALALAIYNKITNKSKA